MGPGYPSTSSHGCAQHRKLPAQWLARRCPVGSAHSPEWRPCSTGSPKRTFHGVHVPSAEVPGYNPPGLHRGIDGQTQGGPVDSPLLELHPADGAVPRRQTVGVRSRSVRRARSSSTRHPDLSGLDPGLQTFSLKDNKSQNCSRYPSPHHVITRSPRYTQDHVLFFSYLRLSGNPMTPVTRCVCYHIACPCTSSCHPGVSFRLPYSHPLVNVISRSDLGLFGLMTLNSAAQIAHRDYRKHHTS
jgi:hypothetical protein